MNAVNRVAFHDPFSVQIPVKSAYCGDFSGKRGFRGVEFLDKKKIFFDFCVIYARCGRFAEPDKVREDV